MVLTNPGVAVFHDSELLVEQCIFSLTLEKHYVYLNWFSPEVAVNPRLRYLAGNAENLQSTARSCAHLQVVTERSFEKKDFRILQKHYDDLKSWIP